MPDAYTRKARLWPAVLAGLPAAALLGAGITQPTRALSLVAMLCGALGMVICGQVRDAGRRLQLALWASWGGSPTVQRLRWRDASDPSQVRRLHERLNPLLSHSLPDQREEANDPAGADRRYDEAVAALRERTRDPQRFRLLFAENAEYGFRRNCLGLRSVALALAATTLIISVLGLTVFASGAQRGVFALASIISLLAFAWWWRVVRPTWVRSAAELYADRLFEAVESLRVEAGTRQT